MNDAFSDYSIPLQLSEEAFKQMMRQRGLDPLSSRIAIADGNVVAIWLVSVRASKAFLISSGTIPRYRSRGISRSLAEDCLIGFRKLGTRSFQTEVLRNNKTAAGLYYSLGMKRTRLLDCYEIAPQDTPKEQQVSLSKVIWTDIAPLAQKQRDWEPSWQNADASLDAISEDLFCLTHHDATGLAAYAAVGKRSGNIHQIAVRPDRRCTGLGTGLIRGIQRQLPRATLRLTNVQHDDTAFQSLLAQVGATHTTGQYELLLTL